MVKFCFVDQDFFAARYAAERLTILDRDVQGLRLAQHERMPSATTYGLLRSAAETIGEWAAMRSEARAVVGAPVWARGRSCDGGVFVSVDTA